LRRLKARTGEHDRLLAEIGALRAELRWSRGRSTCGHCLAWEIGYREVDSTPRF